MRLAIPHATSTATIESLQLQTAFTRSIRILTSWRAFNARCLPSAFDKTKPAQNFQMRGKLNFQMRWKFRIEKGHLLNKFSALALAGAGGIEPPNGGIKIRCLTAWLRPNSPCRGTRDRPARPLPAPPVYRGSHAISTGCWGRISPQNHVHRPVSI